MPADPRLMALPALRKLAEEDARDLFVARYTDAARGLREPGGWLVPLPDGGIGFFEEVSRDE